MCQELLPAALPMYHYGPGAANKNSNNAPGRHQRPRGERKIDKTQGVDGHSQGLQARDMLSIGGAEMVWSRGGVGYHRYRKKAPS